MSSLTRSNSRPLSETDTAGRRTKTVTVSVYDKQAQFVAERAPYRAFCGGISTGKTWVGAYDLICRARPNRTYMVIGHTYTNLRDSSLKSFLRAARTFDLIDPRKLKLSAPPELVLRTGATILFRSADDPESLRGPNLSGVWLDEASLMPKLAYEIAIGRLREEGQQGWLSATFTPKGLTHWTYSTFKIGGPDVSLTTARTADNPFNPPGFAEQLRRNYTEAFARQELDGEFIGVEGATFPPHWLDEAKVLLQERPAGCGRTVLYLDPSQGRDARPGDAQAYVRASHWPGPTRQNLIVLECWSNRESPPEMVARGVRLCRLERPDLWVYETNGTMGLLSAEIERQCKAEGVPVLTQALHHSEPKRWRIRAALMPYLAQGRLRIVDSPGGRELLAQLRDEPFSPHDDAADAAAGAITALEAMLV